MISIGSFCRLKSGGPLMKVISVDHQGKLECKWNGGRHSFPEIALQIHK